MRVHTNQLAIRILGSLTGLGFLAVAGYAFFGGDASLAQSLRERAFWFGVCAAVAGIWAVAVSWLDPDLSGVWCRAPRASRRLEPPPR